MKLNVNLHEDAELRKEVRQLIEGQVRSILSENVKELIIGVMSGAEKKLTAERLERIAKDEVRIHVKSFVNQSSGWNDDFKKLNGIIRQEVKSILDKKEEFIKDSIEKYISNISKETLNEMIDARVEVKVKSVLASLLKGK